LFSKQFIGRLQVNLIEEYNLIVTKLVLSHLNKNPSRITQVDMDKTVALKQLTRLQNIFIESITIAVISIDDIYQSNGKFSYGTDNVSFKKVSELFNELQNKRLVGTKYARSIKKSFYKYKPKLAIDFAKVDMTEAQVQCDTFNCNLKYKLLQQCNLKSIRKNYKSISIRRI